MIVVGLWFVNGQVGHERQVRSSRDWPSTPGVVVAFRANCFVRGKNCNVDIQYRYEVGGRQFEGTRLTFNDFNLTTVYAFRAYQGRYAVRMTVPVFYDPADPASAVLERTAAWALRYLLVGLGAVFIGVFMLLPRRWIYRLGGAPADVAGADD